MPNKLVIEMDTVNDAFTPDVNQEVARILKQIALNLGGGILIPKEGMPIRDINGNTVGRILFVRSKFNERTERLNEIRTEIEDFANRITETHFEDGGRTTYVTISEEHVTYLQGLLEELLEMKGEKFYG